jgi:hypothetical protein
MTKQKEEIISLVKELPDEVADKIIEYILYLRFTIEHKSNETMLLSEDSLSKDWLKEEEEKAWANL